MEDVNVERGMNSKVNGRNNKYGGYKRQLQNCYIYAVNVCMECVVVSVEKQ